MIQKQEILKTPIRYLKGIGPNLASVLNKLGIFNFQDLLYYFPYEYEDRRYINKIKDVDFSKKQMFIGTLEKLSVIRTRRYRTIIKGLIFDGTGYLNLVWFNQAYLAKVLKKGQKIFVVGRAFYNKRAKEIQISPQEYEIIDEGKKKSFNLGGLVPKYSLTEKLTPKKMRRIVYGLLSKYYQQIPEILPQNLINDLKLAPRNWALAMMHFPKSLSSFSKARYRVVFEEFFLMLLTLFYNRAVGQKKGGIAFDIPDTLLEEFQNSLPFKLTSDQILAIKDCYRDMSKPIPMRRLLQGDVGSGKTVVAAAAILAAARLGFQTAFMAPTEILASQHFRTLSEYLKSFKITPILLVSGLNSREKLKILEKIKNGAGLVVVGTHALIQEKVKFQNLGLVIIDEQHRFGVAQRLALIEKGNNPDLLVMTATPIPRTLAFVFYGDLDKSIIKQMPPGRIPVKTFCLSFSEREKVYQFVKNQAEKGHKAFIVFPLLKESEKIDFEAATIAYENFKNGIFSDLPIGLIHGRMKQKEKEKIMKNFLSGKIKILVATTVIEVGVDVPEATIMVIEHAERFGLAVLHQLRGRVGRSGAQAYCFLIAGKSTEDAQKRLKIIESTSDGFKIAEEDFKIRGPGEILGLSQSGFGEFKLAHPVNDLKILMKAYDCARSLIQKDQFLESFENQILKRTILERVEDFAKKIVENT